MGKKKGKGRDEVKAATLNLIAAALTALTGLIDLLTIIIAKLSQE